MSLRAIRTGIATMLKTIDGLTVYERLPEILVPGTSAIVCATRPTGDYGDTAEDVLRHEIGITIVTGLQQGLEAAQDVLDSFIAKNGANSIHVLLWTDHTLSGSAQNWTHLVYRNYGDREYNDVPMLGVDFVLEVWE